MSQPDPFQLVGTTIDGKYRVEEVVGVGGSSVVYRAVHEGFGDADVAVKCLRPPENFSVEGKAAFVGTFRKEAKLLLRLSSEPGIVRVLDLGVTTAPTSARVPFLVLEWLEGSTLADLLAERQRHGLGPFPEREALALLREIANAIVSAHLLQHARGRGIAHRDLKPSNVMQTESTRGPVWKVLDFGIAKAMQAGDHATAASGTPVNVRVFSPLYGAPEQFHPVYGPTGPWTDVHALGLILVELVSGVRALEGADFSALFKSAAAKERPTPRARGARVSDALEALCARAIALKPAERYADAGQLVAAIDAILQRPTADESSLSSRDPRPKQSRVAWWVAGGCLLVAVALLVMRFID